MKETMNILFSCDTNYAMPLTVSITSIFENNKNNNVHIFVLYSSLTEKQKEILNNLAKSYNQNISLIHAEEHYFSTAPVLRWSKEAYYRLLINELLPKDIEKLLYLDCDIIVNKSLNDLYNQDLGEDYISALHITNINTKEFRVRLGLNPDGNYFQTGVILFNIKKCTEILNYEKTTKIINELGNKIITVDQDVINVIFDGKIKPLNPKFNNCDITNFQNNNINRLLNRVDKKLIDETIILHYATGKPWNNLFSGSCEQIWYKYLLLSPYRDFYYKKYNKLKYKILRIGFVKTLFYQYINITPHINNLARTILSHNIYNRFKGFYRKNIK